jgi:hypothetical protein
MDLGRARRLSLAALRVALAIGACLPALWQIALQARLYLARFRYPMDLEWLEGAALYQAYRVMLGQSTYGPPKHGYLPLLHPPVYPTFLGLVGRVVGLNYAMARTISLLFFVGASALIAREIVRQEERRLDGATTALLAIGCAAAGVPFFEGFYDMVREDIMAVFLCVLGAQLAAAEPRKMRPRRILLLAVVLTTALYARFPAVFFLVWINLYVLVRHRRTGVLLALTLTSACGLTLVVLQYVTKGWFWIYTVTLLQDHKVLGSRFLLGIELIVEFAPYVAPIPLLTLVLAVKKRLSARAALWVGMFFASLPAALLPFSKLGGFANDFLPVCFFCGPAAVFLVIDTVKALSAAGWLKSAAAVRYVTYAGLAAYLVLRHYDYTRFVPSEYTWKRATALNKRVADLKGGVIAPRHPFVPIQNGHLSTQQFADMPYLDAHWAGFRELSLGAYLDKIHATYAVVTGTEIPYTAAEVARRYQLEGPIGDAPQMIIGERSLLRYLMRWQDDEKDGRVLFDFEDPELPGWTRTGDAFSVTSTSALPRGQMGIAGVIGQRLANSFHPELKDTAVGTLISPTFVIDRPKMGLRVGGYRPKARVELKIDGKMKRRASGIFEGTETMTHVVWDVSQFQGKEAQLFLIDEDNGYWGHVTVDHVVLY